MKTYENSLVQPVLPCFSSKQSLFEVLEFHLLRLINLYICIKVVIFLHSHITPTPSLSLTFLIEVLLARGGNFNSKNVNFDLIKIIHLFISEFLFFQAYLGYIFYRIWYNSKRYLTAYQYSNEHVDQYTLRRTKNKKDGNKTSQYQIFGNFKFNSNDTTSSSSLTNFSSNLSVSELQEFNDYGYNIVLEVDQSHYNALTKNHREMRRAEGNGIVGGSSIRKNIRNINNVVYLTDKYIMERTEKMEGNTFTCQIEKDLSQYDFDTCSQEKVNYINLNRNKLNVIWNEYGDHKGDFFYQKIVFQPHLFSSVASLSIKRTSKYQEYRRLFENDSFNIATLEVSHTCTSLERILFVTGTSNFVKKVITASCSKYSDKDTNGNENENKNKNKLFYNMDNSRRIATTNQNINMLNQPPQTILDRIYLKGEKEGCDENEEAHFLLSSVKLLQEDPYAVNNNKSFISLHQILCSHLNSYPESKEYNFLGASKPLMLIAFVYRFHEETSSHTITIYTSVENRAYLNGCCTIASCETVLQLLMEDLAEKEDLDPKNNSALRKISHENGTSDRLNHNLSRGSNNGSKKGENYKEGEDDDDEDTVSQADHKNVNSKANDDNNKPGPTHHQNLVKSKSKSYFTLFRRNTSREKQSNEPRTGTEINKVGNVQKDEDKHDKLEKHKEDDSNSLIFDNTILYAGYEILAFQALSKLQMLHNETKVLSLPTQTAITFPKFSPLLELPLNDQIDEKRYGNQNDEMDKDKDKNDNKDKIGIANDVNVNINICSSNVTTATTSNNHDFPRHQIQEQHNILKNSITNTIDIGSNNENNDNNNNNDNKNKNKNNSNNVYRQQARKKNASITISAMNGNGRRQASFLHSSNKTENKIDFNSTLDFSEWDEDKYQDKGKDEVVKKRTKEKERKPSPPSLSSNANETLNRRATSKIIQSNKPKQKEDISKFRSLEKLYDTPSQWQEINNNRLVQDKNIQFMKAHKDTLLFYRLRYTLSGNYEKLKEILISSKFDFDPDGLDLKYVDNFNPKTKVHISPIKLRGYFRREREAVLVTTYTETIMTTERQKQSNSELNESRALKIVSSSIGDEELTTDIKSIFATSLSSKNALPRIIIPLSSYYLRSKGIINSSRSRREVGYEIDTMNRHENGDVDGNNVTPQDKEEQEQDSKNNNDVRGVDKKMGKQELFDLERYVVLEQHPNQKLSVENYCMQALLLKSIMSIQEALDSYDI